MASLCASWCWAAPVTVAAASPSTRPARVTLRALPRAASPAPLLRIQQGRRPHGAFFPSRCQKGADRHLEPEPEPERGREDGGPDSLDVMLKDLAEYSDYYRANKLGLRVPPRMFRKQDDEICEHMKKIIRSKTVPCGNDGKRINTSLRQENPSNNQMAMTVCQRARSSLDIASTVMDITSLLGLGTTEISQHTTDQMVRLYAATFCDAAEAACLTGVEKDTILSFLGALGCLGAIAHILVEDIRAKLKDGPWKNKIKFHLDIDYHEFCKKMDALKKEIDLAERNDARKVLIVYIYFNRLWIRYSGMVCGMQNHMFPN
ncbi:uncharacterized protein LOC124672791 [Lolium rigidum]|uniref:uncharacterized protein LOC124672791 n=1 Tax=Lolium rigidum TaxID=89674 RepID=UPI001F5CF0B1|nr:uncharacterized protein LOC124672791 [Lolium rigidum]